MRDSYDAIQLEYQGPTVDDIELTIYGYDNEVSSTYCPITCEFFGADCATAYEGLLSLSNPSSGTYTLNTPVNVELGYNHFFCIKCLNEFEEKTYGVWIAIQCGKTKDSLDNVFR